MNSALASEYKGLERVYKGEHEDELNTVNNIQLRKATFDDVTQIQHIENTCFKTDKLNVRRFRFYVTASHAEFYIAEHHTPQGVTIAGYGLLLLRRGTQLTRLYSIAVLPEARGFGIAEKLITTLGEQALARGKRFMRLEVSADNKGAIALYQKLGFKQFGMYVDYYDDHSNALRMQKVLVSSKAMSHTVYPWYQQTTEFTCGPAALMMAMCSLQSSFVMNQQKELAIWRTATTIFMTSGHGGCHPIGLALAALQEGFAAEVLINQPLPLFVDGVRSEHKKQIVGQVEADFLLQAQKSGMSIVTEEWRVEAIEQALDAGKAVLCLISTYAFDKKKAPHWVAITSYDEQCFYLHDPDADESNSLDESQRVEFQHIPVARDDFVRLASYGTRKVRTLVVVSTNCSM
ncbi:GNAT family N-acetyltransferase/peptidase C39 family protein [Alteromonas sp. 1_MG-2023]|uniref:GNAT family N-acetyltransferase/peptidase C39 family protein n=1 Tax=Alteromonas sp. 1_MG-2023 TaxID=3062669 RepID=UPI0026E47451|nr:GNAT family N-acetyltransferase/peptidase C39 family protein [Alteromonas sp. 1_MG-2023]MDO6568881.1 GNAT family N-acetyltransferase/peptidase C39 family protein [Alteromonas sp. 1_MG-2023]